MDIEPVSDDLISKVTLLPFGDPAWPPKRSDMIQESRNKLIIQPQNERVIYFTEGDED